MDLCPVCQASSVVRRIDFGAQPISNRYLAFDTHPGPLYPLQLGQCTRCALLFLVNPPPVEELVSRYDWITYLEPEAHLDDLAEILAKLPGLSPESRLCGLTDKDDSTLARMQRRGFSRSHRLDPLTDLELSAGAGLETIQGRIRPEGVPAWRTRWGPCDLIIGRQILEHTFAPTRFITALKQLLAPGGYLVFEVPDSEQALTDLDYLMIWEQHTLYFTMATLIGTLNGYGLDVVWSGVFPYASENSLVAIARLGTPRTLAPATAAAECARAERYSAHFAERAQSLRTALSQHRQAGGKVALLGAGHLACAFLSIYGLGDLIEFVADDHPPKIGLYLPGSRLPILPSSALVEHGITWCLLTMRPDREEAVIDRQRPFLESGGQFFSILPASPRHLEIRHG